MVRKLRRIFCFFYGHDYDYLKVMTVQWPEKVEDVVKCRFCKKSKVYTTFIFPE